MAPNGFTGILTPAARAGPGLGQLFSDPFVWRFSTASAAAVHSAIQLQRPARAGQGPSLADQLRGIAGPSPTGHARYQSGQSTNLPGLGEPGQGCGPTGEDNTYNFTLPAGSTLTLPTGQVITGDASGGTPIFLAGTRPFSAPNCVTNGPNAGTNCPQNGNPVFTNIFAEDTIANSSYNSLQTMLEKRFSHGLQFQAAYTWSKSIDWASSFEETLNPFDFKKSRGLSLFNSAHRFVINYVWDVPVPRLSGHQGEGAR